MTPSEHSLMIFMFTRQALLIKALVEALKSNGILQNDDFRAFDALVWDHEAKGDERMIDATAKRYQQYAQSLGVDLGLSGI